MRRGARHLYPLSSCSKTPRRVDSGGTRSYRLLDLVRDLRVGSQLEYALRLLRALESYFVQLGFFVHTPRP